MEAFVACVSLLSSPLQALCSSVSPTGWLVLEAQGICDIQVSKQDASEFFSVMYLLLQLDSTLQNPWKSSGMTVILGRRNRDRFLSLVLPLGIG